MAESYKRKLIVDGVEHDVELLNGSTEGSLLVRFDNAPLEVFLGESSNLGRLILLDGHPIRVRPERGVKGYHLLLVNDEKIAVSFTLATRREIPMQITAGERAASRKISIGQKNVVVAHMPGRIGAVKVKLNEHVEIGTPMLVLVAMKMENTIVAPTGGSIKELRVSPGQTVNKGEILAIIE